MEIRSKLLVPGLTDASDPTLQVDFTSRNEHRITVTETPMITPLDVIALLEGGHLWKLRMPLPDASQDPHIPENLTQIAEAMARKYTTAEYWWREGSRNG
ncbi:hypothetical protein [Methylocaldum marinum]|nr:hypothetical protein [Methylocaldum marinum]